VVCERSTLCSLGSKWLSCAASWLECERWYVGMAVLEAGVGGPLGVAEQVDVGAASPKLRLRGPASSFSFESPVSTLPIAIMASSL
jgi:hypothetical protein